MTTANAIPADVALHEHLRAHARRQPNKPVFIWYGYELSYSELDRASDAFAARLEELGVRKGDPVMLFMGNCPQYLMAHFGIQKLGAVVCPSSPLNKQHELAYQIGDLGARVIVAAQELLPVVQAARTGTALTHVFVVNQADLLPDAPVIDVPSELLAMRDAAEELPAGCEDFLSAARSGAPVPVVQTALDDVGLICYTSGSTGMPKGAMLTLGNALAKTIATVQGMDLRPDDVTLSAAPLYHIAGMLIGLDATIHSGTTSVLLFRFDPVAVLQAISRWRVSWWYSIAPMNMAVMQLPEAKRYNLSSLRENRVTSFGVTLTEALAQRWREFAPNCVCLEAGYGLTETHTCDAVMPNDAIRWGTLGKVTPGSEIRIVDPATGNPCAPGEQGEITIRSPGNFKGYLNKPEATAITLRDGWVWTGDLGYLDEDGYLTFKGRLKEMIKVSGYSVFPDEVESILSKHPAIASLAVIGIPHPSKGEIIKAFVVRRPGKTLTEQEVIDWSRDNMAAYKVPRAVEFRDALPTTGAGKVLRRLLKDEQGAP